MNVQWLANEGMNVYSQFGEDGVIDAIFSRIGVENSWCFECGAGDGIFFSNTRRLIEMGWTAVLVEADRVKYAALRENSAAFGDRVMSCCTRLEQIDPLLASVGAPADIDLAVIDVDGQDCHLFNSMLRFHPRVVMIEFDPNAVRGFIPAIGCPGQAGVEALHEIAYGRFYTPVARTWNNLIMVAQPLDDLLLGEEP